jgi:hypothetical protein
VLPNAILNPRYVRFNATWTSDFERSVYRTSPSSRSASSIHPGGEGAWNSVLGHPSPSEFG